MVKKRCALQEESETNSQNIPKASLGPAGELVSVVDSPDIQILKDGVTPMNDDENVKQGINEEDASDVEIKLRSEVSDISNDALFDEDEHNNSQLQTSEVSISQQHDAKNLYSEIDTEAETDKEDNI